MKNNDQSSKNNELGTPNEFVEAIINKSLNLASFIGESGAFEYMNIESGDLLITKSVTNIPEGTLGFWQEVETGRINVAFHYDNFGDITLYNQIDVQKRFKKSEIKPVAIVVGVVKAITADINAEVSK